MSKLNKSKKTNKVKNTNKIKKENLLYRKAIPCSRLFLRKEKTRRNI